MDTEQIVKDLECAINDLDYVQGELSKKFQDYDISDPENLYERAYQILNQVEDLLAEVLGH